MKLELNLRAHLWKMSLPLGSKEHFSKIPNTSAYLILFFYFTTSHGKWKCCELKRRCLSLTPTQFVAISRHSEPFNSSLTLCFYIRNVPFDVTLPHNIQIYHKSCYLDKRSKFCTVKPVFPRCVIFHFFFLIKSKNKVHGTIRRFHSKAQQHVHIRMWCIIIINVLKRGNL